MTLSLINSIRSTMCDAIADSVDAGPGAGTIAIRSGSRPALPTDAATGTLLVTITLVDPAFGAASNGVATINDPGAVNAVATGTASWFRAFDSTGAVCFDGSITSTGGGGDLTMPSTSITSGQPVDITGGTITVPAS